MIQAGIRPPVLIFVQSKERAQGEGIGFEMKGNLPKREREEKKFVYFYFFLYLFNFILFLFFFFGAELFRELVYDGINVDVIHADRTKQQVGECGWRKSVWIVVVVVIVVIVVIVVFGAGEYALLEL